MTDHGDDSLKGSTDAPLVVLVTGLSGAGRTTVINTLEDLGFEALDNFPLSLIDRLVRSESAEPPPIGR